MIDTFQIRDRLVLGRSLAAVRRAAGIVAGAALSSRGAGAGSLRCRRYGHPRQVATDSHVGAATASHSSDESRGDVAKLLGKSHLTARTRCARTGRSELCVNARRRRR
jgi:hypothetical protein